MQKWNIFWSAVRRSAAEPAEPAEPIEPVARRGIISRLWREEEGQTLVEYGMMIALLALVVVAAVTLFGRRMSNNLYGTANNGLPFNN